MRKKEKGNNTYYVEIITKIYKRGDFVVNIFKYIIIVVVFSFISGVNIACLEAAAPLDQGVDFNITRVELPKDQDVITGFFKNRIDKALVLTSMDIDITILDTSNNVVRTNHKTLALPNIYIPASGGSDIYKFSLDNPGNKAYLGQTVMQTKVQIRWRTP